MIFNKTEIDGKIRINFPRNYPALVCEVNLLNSLIQLAIPSFLVLFLRIVEDLKKF